MARLHLLLLIAGLHSLTALAVARSLGAGIAEPPSSSVQISSNNAKVVPGAAAPPAAVDTVRPDKSIVGAEAILGCFATAVLAVIFCYIRVTRKHGEDKA